MFIVIQEFITSFFYQILYMSVIATIIGGVILLLRKTVIKTISPKFSCIIWLFFIAVLIFPISLPSKVSIYNYVKIDDIKYSEKSNNIAEYYDSEELQTSAKRNNIVENNNKLIVKCFEIIIVDIWLCIVLFKTIVAIMSHKSLLKNIGDNELRDERIVKILERCKKKLKIKTNIKIIKQDHIIQPSTLGVFNVKILFTESVLELDDISINNIIMHELSHHKRKDNVLNALVSVIRIVHWFNPFLNLMFKRMRQDMELATDEMAIKNMNKEEITMYCKIIVETAKIISYEPELLLGLTNESDDLGERIDMICLQEKIKKCFIPMLITTILIVLIICFLLYPTSYGMFDVPKLYLELENGKRIEAFICNEDDYIELNTIKVNEKSNAKLLVQGGKVHNYILYNKVDLNNSKKSSDISNLPDNEISYFEKGEYIYKFTIMCGKNKSVDYAIKIIVE